MSLHRYAARTDANALRKAKAAARKAYAEQLAAPAGDRKTILPKPLGSAAKLLGFEQSTPRCETCRQYAQPKTLIHKQTANLPVVVVPPVCKRGRFYTAAGSLCNHWTGHDGSTLEQ